MTRDELLAEIDGLSLFEKDYLVLVKLINNTSPRLFTKIFEEICLGNLYYSDFESFLDESEKEAVNDEIKRQADLENRLYRLIALRREIDSRTGSESVNSVRIALNPEFNRNYSEMSSLEKQDKIYDLLSEKTKDPVNNEIRMKLLTRFANDPDSLLLSRDRLLIPIQYSDIQLTKDDYNYIIENGISEDEFKKMKSVALYLFDKGDR